MSCFLGRVAHRRRTCQSPWEDFKLAPTAYAIAFDDHARILRISVSAGFPVLYTCVTTIHSKIETYLFSHRPHKIKSPQ